VGLLGGCGSGIDEPPLVPVTGTVNVDGTGAEGLEIEFLPQTTGGVSTAKTGPGGKYELIYKDGSKGAVIGTHTVKIVRPNPGGGPAGGETGAVVENPLPAKYNDQTTLTADVKEGNNDIPFELSTK
jgi:hypothetical protein